MNVQLVNCRSGYHARIGYLMAVRSDPIGDVWSNEDVTITVERSEGAAIAVFEYRERPAQKRKKRK